jgi:hypothetical protein
MPYLSGVLTGVALVILVLLLVDNVGTGPRVVNWDVLSARLGRSADEVRQEVHEATAPDKGVSAPDAPPPSAP